MKNVLLASVALVAMIGHAEAQDAGYNWSGFYVGAQAGYGRSSAEFSGSPGFFFGPGLVPEGDHHKDGFVGGIHAGYDWQEGNYVFGALADLDYIDVDQLQLEGFTTGKEEAYTYDIDWLGTARVRAGYLPTERLLVYGTGGVAFTHVEATSKQHESIPIDQTTTAGNSGVEVGGVIGLGAEYAVTQNWSVKAEYLHYDFNSLQFSSGNPPARMAGQRSPRRIATSRVSLNRRPRKTDPSHMC